MRRRPWKSAYPSTSYWIFPQRGPFLVEYLILACGLNRGRLRKEVGQGENDIAENILCRLGVRRISDTHRNDPDLAHIKSPAEFLLQLPACRFR